MLPLKVCASDDYQTPEWPVRALAEYLPPGVIWEPACGNGNIVALLTLAGRKVHATDIKIQGNDFLTGLPSDVFDLIVTNPPYSTKDRFLARCYQLCKPFALLMPLSALEGIKRQTMYREKGIELILFDRRVVYERPDGKKSSPHFSSAWFTWGFNIGQALTFYETDKLK